MASKIKVDELETVDGTGTIALQNQISGMTSASMPTGSIVSYKIVTMLKQTLQVSTCSSAYIEADTGLRTAHAITPSSTSSKILVLLLFKTE